jgi:hypothetical protein
MEKKRLKYEPPLLRIETVELEYGIATGSVQTGSEDGTGVQHQWDDEVEDNRDIGW